MRACKYLSFCVLSVLLAPALYADGSLWDLSMPTIESPSLGTGFYTPSNSPSPFMSGRGETGPASGSGKSSGSSVTSSGQAKSSAGGEASSSQVRSMTLAGSVSARDLEAMDSLGLLGGLSGILSEGYGSSLYSRSAGSAMVADRTEETNRLLNRVLDKMEEIKENGGSSRTESSAILVSEESELSAESSSSSSSGSENPAAAVRNKSRLLRFSVNGYNVLRTCRTVYISDVQDNGTFLVTGDRRYMSDGKTRSETFHILFKTKPDSTSVCEYDAATAVTQDSYNPNSFVYQLSKRRNMMASRTGNLVSMRTEDPDWRLELLIDLGE